MDQLKLEELLKKKGIGPQGSKSLNKEELDSLQFLFASANVSLTTKATMLTALLTLDPNEEEKEFLEKIALQPETYIPVELTGFINQKTDSEFLRLINKIISHKDLTEGESDKAMRLFFDAKEPEYLKAAFLEAERLKRETFIENKHFFSALWNNCSRAEIDIPVLIHICDSYDGSNRTRNFSPFVAALLAAAGFPCLITGLDSVAPKSGHTPNQILKAAGKNPYQSIQGAIQELINSGWTYLDQQVFFPELYKLKTMRKEMVKRPFLATFEKLLQPIRSRGHNYIVTGYTHPHYREELIKQIKEQGKTYQAIVLKGMEGGTHLSMTRETVCVHFDGEQINDLTVSPSQYHLQEAEEKHDKEVTAYNSLNEGTAALKGEKNMAREKIVYLACIIADKFSLLKSENRKLLFENLIDSGAALGKWQNKC